MGKRGLAVVAECPGVASGSITSPPSVSSEPSLHRCAATAAVLALILFHTSVPVQAQDRCFVLCAPEVKIEPTFTVENLFRPPVVETIENGVVVERVRERRERVFELIVAVEVPTVVPRIGLTFEAIFTPFGSADANPFTGSSAEGLGRSSIRDNGIEIETELNVMLFDEEQTGGWVSSHVDIVDQFSPAEHPAAGSVYTHKLNFEWDTAFHVFNRLPDGNWLRNVEAELSLDYLATGLPGAGDLLGGERFVDGASPWSLSFVLVMPLAPLVP
jgi:hypothetical protein